MANEIFSIGPPDGLKIIDKSKSIKSATAEPGKEIEDFNDLELMKILIHEFGLNEEVITSQEPLTHRNTKDCVHCRIVKKVQSLQIDIQRMNSELRTTDYKLGEKKKQNGEISSMIKRLEENLGADRENSTKLVNCSCFNKCFIF